VATNEKTEHDLDEALEETFPASDPPANTVETGIIPHDLSVPPEESRSELVDRVSDNRAANRFELIVDGQTAFLTYVRTPTTLTIVHTEVPEALRGRGAGSALVDVALDRGHSDGLQVIVQCPFARAYLKKRRLNS
jgi:hypothetical protein